MVTNTSAMVLARRMADLGPLCVGIDPHPSLLQAWGLPVSVDGLRVFGETCVRELSGIAAALKPQVAFYESFGSAGLAALEEVIAAARAQGHYVITDAKRGDIGSTMAGYAEAYLRRGAPLESDAVTLSPYLGFGALEPAISCAQANDKAVFVLALTSNPQGASIQHARRADGTSVAGAILSAAQEENAKAMAAVGANVGPVGLVVGATVGSAPHDLGLDLSDFNGIFLAPGVGAQGAGGAECRQVFGSARVLASVSRSVLSAGPGALAGAASAFVSQILHA